MNAIDSQIISLLDMIPFFPKEEKRDFVLHKMPNLSLERKNKVFEELGTTFRKLVAEIPLNSIVDADFSSQTKQHIFEIEKTYLHELQKIESHLLSQFFEAEKKVRAHDLAMAEKMIEHMTI